MKYRKKPIVVEAVKIEKGFNELALWCRGEVLKDGRKISGILIPTLEGVMIANIGDWIIKGVKGEFYPCKPDIFAATYDEVDE